MSNYIPFDPDEIQSVASVAVSHVAHTDVRVAKPPVSALSTQCPTCDTATLATLRISDDLHDSDPNAWLAAMAWRHEYLPVPPPPRVTTPALAGCEAEQLRQAARAQVGYRTGRTTAFGDEAAAP